MDDTGRTVIEELNRAVALHQSGDLDKAEKAYRRILGRAPAQPGAMQLLGALELQRGRLDDAERLIAAAITARPRSVDLHYLMGRIFMARRMLDKATASFKTCIELDGRHENALVSLALTLHETGDTRAALTWIRKAVAANPRSFDGWYNQAVLLASLGELADALAAYRQSLAIRPAFLDGHRAVGHLLLQLDRPMDALASFDRMRALEPDNAQAWSGIGRVLARLERFAEAVAAFDKALAIDANSAEAWLGRGNACILLGEFDEAEAALTRALAIDPRFAHAALARGDLLTRLKRYDEAVADFDAAILLEPDLADAHFGRAGALIGLGDREGFVASVTKGLAADPDSVIGRWALAILAKTPIIAAADENLDALRTELGRNLAELDRWHDVERTGDTEAVGNSTPFYLAYQEENNRELLSRYGALCGRLMKRWQDKQAFPPRRRVASQAVRVGIASAHIYDHSVWHAIVKGWLSQFDPRRVELHLVHLGHQQDAETDWARSKAASFEIGSRSIRRWADSILDRQFDALIYPEIGMDLLTVKLASLRLAPLQAATWGHPETTGLPTIDCYLSAAAFEPAQAQDNYTERLVTLPNLGCFVEPHAVASSPPDLAALGIRPGVPLLLCPGTPFKYAPQYDTALARIAAGLGACQLVFFESPLTRRASAMLRRRLEASFARLDMRFDDYGLFIPWQNRATFFGLLKTADVYLDTIGFSGFNTAMQAIECGLPVVTREGRFLRGRLASGILKRLDMADVVSATIDDYVGAAVRLASDPDVRQSYRDRIDGARAILFRDAAAVRALERFLLSSAGRN